MEKWIWTESGTTFYSQDPPDASSGSWREEEAGRGGGLKNGQKSEVLRMRFPIVENVRTSSDILLHTSRGLQLPYREKSKKSSFFTRKSKIPYFSVFSTLVDGHCFDPCLGARNLGAPVYHHAPALQAVHGDLQ